ncbi:MAG: beta-propeller domain-containing protein [Oscillospiraceae bacterium]|nr:beta-propeller domain-containing protein [Oscillospiraceae bacterium]
MKKTDIASLREALMPLDEHCPLPEALKAERILQHAGQPRRSHGAPLRPRLALAAALAVVLSAAVLFSQANLWSSGPYHAAPTEDTADFGTSYHDLEQAFLRMREERQDVYRGEKRGAYNGFDFAEEDQMTMPASMPEFLQAGPMQTTRNAGETNTQVRGVDEADILKNDGEYLYYIQGSRLYIVRALPEMKVLSSMAIPGYRMGTELYIQGGRMALVYSEYPPGGDPAASVQVYDIADREHPVLAKSFSQPGYLLSSRMINGRVYLLSTQGANLDFRVKNGAIPEEDILPVVYEDGQPRILPAGCIAIMPEAQEPGYLLVSSLDIAGGKSESESAAILGAGSQMYCSQSALFVACQQYGGMDGLMRRMMPWGIGSKTLIYKFDLLPEGKIKAAGAGEAPGAPLNQFSMDEYKGYFRIATTGNREEDGETVNFLTVLDGSLKRVGGIENLAPGERIQSARFIGGKGYLVTFRQTDPLFVIDLENPSAPALLGELKLPGFSAYLHPWDATHLVGIGPGGNERGTDNSMKLSLFDISDPARPREVDKVIVPNMWSEIQQNHKILALCPEKGLFGLSLGSYEHGGVSFYTFHVQGDGITRSWTLEPTGRGRPWEDDYGGSREGGVLRGTYIGDTWYVLGQFGVAAYAMDSGRAAGTVMF